MSKAMRKIDDVPDIRYGQEWFNDTGTVRVMAFSGGYVMARRPGCFPFVEFWTDFVSHWDGPGRSGHSIPYGGEVNGD